MTMTEDESKIVTDLLQQFEMELDVLLSPYFTKSEALSEPARRSWLLGVAVCLFNSSHLVGASVKAEFEEYVARATEVTDNKLH